MKCPYELPLRSYKAMNHKYCVCEKNANVLFNCLTKEQACYIIHALNCHEKLVNVVKDMLSGLEYMRRTGEIPYGFGIDRLEKAGTEALAEANEEKDNGS